MNVHHVAQRPVDAARLVREDPFGLVPIADDVGRHDDDQLGLIPGVGAEAEGRPERVMDDLKSYASRCLNRTGLDEPDRKRWARHGSTRWLWTREQVAAAIRYVVDKQGEPMAVFGA